jgi:hypothetical protein
MSTVLVNGRLIKIMAPMMAASIRSTASDGSFDPIYGINSQPRSPWPRPRIFRNRLHPERSSDGDVPWRVRNLRHRNPRSLEVGSLHGINLRTNGSI